MHFLQSFLCHASFVPIVINHHEVFLGAIVNTQESKVIANSTIKKFFIRRCVYYETHHHPSILCNSNPLECARLLINELADHSAVVIVIIVVLYATSMQHSKGVSGTLQKTDKSKQNKKQSTNLLPVIIQRRFTLQFCALHHSESQW